MSQTNEGNNKIDEILEMKNLFSEGSFTYEFVTTFWVCFIFFCNAILIGSAVYLLIFVIILIVFISDSSYYGNCSGLVDFSEFLLYGLLISGIISALLIYLKAEEIIVVAPLVFVMVMSMVWYAIDIDDTENCENLGALLLANNIILFSDFVLFIPVYIERDFRYGQMKEELNTSTSKLRRSSDFTIVYFFLAIVLTYDFIFMILLNIYSSDISYYGSNCSGLLEFTNVFNGFQYTYEFFEGIYILVSISQNSTKYVLYFWGIFFYFSAWGLGIYYLIVMGISADEDCQDLGSLYQVNFVVIYILIPFGACCAYAVGGPWKLITFFLKEIVLKS